MIICWLLLWQATVNGDNSKALSTTTNNNNSSWEKNVDNNDETDQCIQHGCYALSIDNCVGKYNNLRCTQIIENERLKKYFFFFFFVLSSLKIISNEVVLVVDSRNSLNNNLYIWQEQKYNFEWASIQTRISPTPFSKLVTTQYNNNNYNNILWSWQGCVGKHAPILIPYLSWWHYKETVHPKNK